MIAGMMKTIPPYSVPSRLRPGSVKPMAKRQKMTADQNANRDMGAS